MSTTHSYDRESFLDEFFPGADERAEVEAGAQRLVHQSRARRLAEMHVSEADPGRAALSQEVAAESALPDVPLFYSEELVGARDEELLRQCGYGDRTPASCDGSS